MRKFYKMNGSKHDVCHEFFSNINSEEQAYLLGFYVADGNVNEKRKTFRIKIKEIDSEIIELYKQFICPTAHTFIYKSYKIKGRDNKEYVGCDQISVDINSSKLVNSLVDLGYGYKKTYLDMKLPKLSDDLIIHFIRGYFDGDGSITKNIVYNTYNKPRLKLSISFTSKKRSLFDDIKLFFEKYNINFNIHYNNRDNCYLLQTASIGNIKQIYDILYKDAHFYMSRKYNKFSYYVNTEIPQYASGDCNAQEMSVEGSNNSPKSTEHPTQDENVC